MAFVRALPVLAAMIFTVAAGCDFVDQGLPATDGSVSLDAPWEPDGSSSDASSSDASVPDAITFDAAQLCGDDARTGTEVCDGDDFGDVTCATRGFVQGQLACVNNCTTIDDSGCFDCPLLEETGTVALWCFEEGSGTSSASLVAGANDVVAVAGGSLPWQSGGGVNLSASTLSVGSSVALELGAPWRVEVAATVSSITNDDVILFERTAFPGQTTEVNHWLRIYLDSDRSIQCDTGREANNISYYGARSAAAAFATGTPHVFACERPMEGGLKILVDGVDVTGSSFGGEPNMAPHAYAATMTLGGGDTGAAFEGLLRAVAIHDLSCGLDPRPGTAGLWCFEEGSGTNSAAVAGSAPAVTGISGSEWLRGHGLALTDAAATVADDAGLDLEPPWSVSVIVALDSLQNATILERASFDGSDEQAWVDLRVHDDGSVSCRVGDSGGATFVTTTTAASALSIDTVHRIDCTRDASGGLSIQIDSTDATDATSGTPTTVTVAADQPFRLGHSTCSPTQCPGLQPLHGKLLAWGLFRNHTGNLAALWSSSQGLGGIRYMSYDGTSFSDMGTYDAGLDQWNVVGNAQCKLQRHPVDRREREGLFGSSPGAPGGTSYPSPVTRWTAPGNGDVTVHTRLASPFDGNANPGTVQRYYRNGTLVHAESATTSPTFANYSRTITGVSAGDTIEWELYSNGGSALDPTFAEYIGFDQ